MKIGIVACGAIVRELLAIARRQAWDFELTAVPAQLHMKPEQIAPAVQAELDAWAGRFDLILVGYADCGTGGALDALLARYANVLRLEGPHCYEFFGGEAFTRHNDEHIGTFYLTDFLARHFDGLVWKGLGLDRYPQLLETYFGNYTHVLYLRQQAENDQSAYARRAAERMQLTYLEHDTGLEVLEARVVAQVQAFAARSAAASESDTGAPTSPAGA